MESHVAEGVDISEADIDRVEKAISGGKFRGATCFPGWVLSRHSNIGNRGDHQRPLHEKSWRRCRRCASLLPTTRQRRRRSGRSTFKSRFHLSATQLAKGMKLTPPKSHALRQKLGIDADPQCMHTFTFGKSKARDFSEPQPPECGRRRQRWRHPPPQELRRPLTNSPIAPIRTSLAPAVEARA